MKRAGKLIEQIADPENIRYAFWKAQKSKEGKREVIGFRNNLDENVKRMRNEILSGNVSVGNYHYFKIFDPKERIICAASFNERVLHHAIMNICHPVFERYQIHHSYATRKDKGQYAALEYAQKNQSKYNWFCKLDIRKYFDSIDHIIMKDNLLCLFKDKILLQIFSKIIDSYEINEGKGIPIGNLTSQYFANYYLSVADHFLLEKIHVPAYVRYMDDMVFWHNDKEKLLKLRDAFTGFITSKLNLNVKPDCLNACDKGLSYLGYSLFPNGKRMNKSSRKRFRKKFKGNYDKLIKGEISQKQFVLNVKPILAFANHADNICDLKKNVKKLEADYWTAPTA